MRALIQRAASASVRVGDRLTGEIGPGLLILICAMQGDAEADADRLAARIAKLRVFRDDAGKMNLSLADTGGAALVVSQFTLAADTSRGNRPGFSAAAPPDVGKALYLWFSDALRALGVTVANGEFGADMDVALVNQGPVTIWLDTAVG
jgi:D-aminoacyl-tRNA deacylase